MMMISWYSRARSFYNALLGGAGIELKKGIDRGLKRDNVYERLAGKAFYNLLFEVTGMTTISIQSKYSTATIECAKGYIRFYNGQLADAYEALRADFFDTVQHRNDESLEDQHVTIMRCVRDIGYNAGVLVKGHGRVIFSGIILDDTQATIPAQREDIMNAERTVQRLIDNDIFTGCNELVQRLSTDLNYVSASLVECEPQLFFKEDRSELPTGFTIKQEMLADNYIVLDEDGDEVAFDADEATAISESWGSASEEPPMVESLQYWIVSDWLANKLEDVGALVAHDVLGFAIWGRSECGQCLAMDSDLNAVAKLLERI